MTTMEFEGRTEREAVAKAAAELGSESFDVEIIEEATGFFRRGKVRIRVRPLTEIPNPMQNSESLPNKKRSTPRSAKPVKPEKKVAPQREEPEVPQELPPKKILQKIAEFIDGVVEKMGYSGTASFKDTEGSNLIFEIKTDFSNIIIGKRGKNLDALQILANIYFIRKSGVSSPWRIMLDAEGYRQRQKENLIGIANRTAEEVLKTGSSRLLEPMNPLERRLIHTALADHENILTKSEGDGTYKRVRIISKHGSRNRSKYHR